MPNAKATLETPAGHGVWQPLQSQDGGSRFSGGACPPPQLSLAEARTLMSLPAQLHSSLHSTGAGQ